MDRQIHAIAESMDKFYALIRHVYGFCFGGLNTRLTHVKIVCWVLNKLIF